MKMQKSHTISSVFGAIWFAVLISESSWAAPPLATPGSIHDVSNTSSDAIVFVYIPRTWNNRSLSRRNYLLSILTKITEAVHKSAEVDVEAEGKPSDSENLLLKDRIDRNRFRPFTSTQDDDEPIKHQFSFPESSSDFLHTRSADYGSQSQTQSREEGGPLTFQDRHNPNNILQKGSVAPANSQSSEKYVSSGSAIQSEQSRRKVMVTRSDAIDTKDLAFDILRNSDWGNGNAVMSPFSVYNSLALLMLGADGRTFNELAMKIRKSDSLESSDEEKLQRFHSAFQRLLRYLNTNSGSDVALETANIIFTDSKFPIKRSYIEEAREYYDAPVETIDFETKGEQFKDQVNKWVSQKTHGKIESIIHNSPSIETTFVFVNAVYFKGQWETSFPKHFTRTKDFFVSPRETVPTKLMTNQISIPYMENEQYQMISLPYKDKKTAFFVMLPREINGVQGLKNLEASLDSRILMESVRSMVPQEVALKIPKMQIRTDGAMQDVLTKMGLSSIFDPQNANFTRLSGRRGLYVSSIYHQSCIDLDEVGTEASAVTAGIVDRIIGDTPVTFIANRPFIFFIYHIKAETILFWGRFVKPQLPA